MSQTLSHPYHFPKSFRLLNRKSFRQVQQMPREPGKYLLFCCRESSILETRLGITVSKKYGSAVKRNRFKRIVREAFRKLHPSLPSGLDIVVFPRSGAKTATADQIQEDFFRFVKKKGTS